jgi:hypothetical protein
MKTLLALLGCQPTTLVGVLAALEHVSKPELLTKVTSGGTGETILSGIHECTPGDIRSVVRPFPLHLVATLRGIFGMRRLPPITGEQIPTEQLLSRVEPDEIAPFFQQWLAKFPADPEANVVSENGSPRGSCYDPADIQRVLCSRKCGGTDQDRLPGHWDAGAFHHHH